LEKLNVKPVDDVNKKCKVLEATALAIADKDFQRKAEEAQRRSLLLTTGLIMRYRKLSFGPFESHFSTLGSENIYLLPRLRQMMYASAASNSNALGEVEGPFKDFRIAA
jgi:hypothetical protein